MYHMPSITEAVTTRIECEKKEASIFTNWEKTAENHIRILGLKIAIENPCRKELILFCSLILQAYLFPLFHLMIQH